MLMMASYRLLKEMAIRDKVNSKQTSSMKMQAGRGFQGEKQHNFMRRSKNGPQSSLLTKNSPSWYAQYTVRFIKSNEHGKPNSYQHTKNSHSCLYDSSLVLPVLMQSRKGKEIVKI